MSVTQQQWAFKVGDGGGPEVFTQIEGMREAPEFIPFQRTIRDITTIDVAASSTTKKFGFNRQMEGQEFSITLMYMPGSTVQDRLFDNEGVDAGVNVQFVYSGTTETLTWEFNVLVMSRSMSFASSTDSEAEDTVTLTLKVNSTPTETIT